MKSYIRIKYLLIVILLGIGLQANSQSREQKKEMRMKIKILDDFSKLECYDKNENYSMLFIYYYKFRKKPKGSMFNDKLMNHLVLMPRDGNYYCDATLIYNDSLRIVATTDNLRVFCDFSPFSFFSKLLELAKEEQMILFRILDIDMRFMFAKKEGKFFAIRDGDDKLDLNVYSIDSSFLDKVLHAHNGFNFSSDPDYMKKVDFKTLDSCETCESRK